MYGSITSEAAGSIGFAARKIRQSLDFELVGDAVPVSMFCCGRCSMPSLGKMPAAARNAFSSLLGFFSSNSPTHSSNSVGLKVTTKQQPFSTPQVNRKDKSNGIRRMSESGTTNGKAKNGNLPKFRGDDIEKWEPDVYEKELLRRTWSDEFDFLYELGSAIYMYIFNHNPQAKKLFPFVELYGDNWKDSKEFRKQALKFVQTLSQVVKNLYHMDRLEPYLYGIGQRHCKFADRGFKPEFWDVFLDAMETSLAAHMNALPDLTDEQHADAVNVWRTLAYYVITHMKHGYNDGLHGIDKHKSSLIA